MIRCLKRAGAPKAAIRKWTGGGEVTAVLLGASSGSCGTSSDCSNIDLNDKTPCAGYYQQYDDYLYSICSQFDKNECISGQLVYVAPPWPDLICAPTPKQ